jgi:DNA topoisomerase-3
MLILTEKPSVAKSFAAALGVPRKGPCYENESFCIVNAVGHLLEDYAPEDYDPELKKWSLSGLPIIPDKVKYKPIAATKDQLAVVKKCFDAHKGDDFLLATDAEREGELIGAEILDYVGFNDYGKARRFWVSEALTPEVVKKGIADAKPLSDYASYRDQGYARQFGDWLAGMNLTRLISIKAHSDGALHFGRVQCAVLGAVAAREKEVTEFKKEKYIEVTAALQTDGAPFNCKLLNPDAGEFPQRFPPEAPLVIDVLAKKDTLKTGKITTLSREKKTLHPPKLFNLTGLQKAASAKFSYTPEETLGIAQALYETHKCLSYPRTPSRVMGDENVELVKGIFAKLAAAYPKEAADADPERITADNKRLFNSAELQDHHALIPLAPIPDDASEKEKNVYRLVLNSLFTILKAPYIYNALSADVDVSGYKFQGAGVEVIDPGWKKGAQDDEDEEPDQVCSGLAEGAEYPVASLAAEEKLTEPKKRYTDASILSLMENPRGDDGAHLVGIGTPATRGAVIDKLFKRGYLDKQGKSIIPTEKCLFLINTINNNPSLAAFISIPETTRWEEQLHNETGKFLEDIKAFVINAVKNTQVERAASPERTPIGKCPLCGGDIFSPITKDSKTVAYCANYKLDPPCKFAIYKVIAGAPVSVDDAKLLLSGKPTKPKKCRSQAGKEFSAAFSLEGGKIVFKFENSKK